MMLEHNEQDAVNNTGQDVHDECHHQGSTGGIPLEESQGNAFDEGDDQIDNEKGEETEDDEEKRRLHANQSSTLKRWHMITIGRCNIIVRRQAEYTAMLIKQPPHFWVRGQRFCTHRDGDHSPFNK
jgi:hypothetical protein